MPKPVAAAFDYTSVSAQNRKALQDTAGAIRAALRRTTDEMLAIGAALRRARDVLAPTGRFQHWVEAELGMSARTARLFVAASERFGRAEKISALALPPTAVLRLAAAPDEAVAAVVQRAEAGERVRVADVDRIIRAMRPARDAAPAAPEPGAPVARTDRYVGTIGAAGLMALCDRARDEAVPRFLARLDALVDAIDAAVDAAAAGRPPARDALQATIQPMAAWLAAELRRLSDRVPPDTPPSDGSPLQHAQHEDRRWGWIATLLAEVVSQESWDATPASQLADWLETVTPPFCTALERESSASLTALRAAYAKRNSRARRTAPTGQPPDAGSRAEPARPARTASKPAPDDRAATAQDRPDFPGSPPRDLPLPVFLRNRPPAKDRRR